MTANEIKKEIRTLCNTIYTRILESYVNLKEHNFHRAWSVPDGTISNSVKEITMRNGHLIYKLRSCEYGFFSDETRRRSLIENFNLSSTSNVNDDISDLFLFSLGNSENKAKAEIRPYPKSNFLKPEEFSEYCSDNYITNEKVKYQIRVFSSIPVDMNLGYQGYTQLIEKVKKEYDDFSDEINKNLNSIGDSVDYIGYYQNDPEMFLTQFDMLSDLQKEVVFTKILADKSIKPHPDVNKIVSANENYCKILRSAARKSMKEPKE